MLAFTRSAIPPPTLIGRTPPPPQSGEMHTGAAAALNDQRNPGSNARSLLTGAFSQKRQDDRALQSSVRLHTPATQTHDVLATITGQRNDNRSHTSDRLSQHGNLASGRDQQSALAMILTSDWSERRRSGAELRGTDARALIGSRPRRGGIAKRYAEGRSVRPQERRFPARDRAHPTTRCKPDAMSIQPIKDRHLSRLKTRAGLLPAWRPGQSKHR